MVSEGSLFFKLVLAQGAKCRIFVTKGHQLSPGLPKMNLVTFGRGGANFLIVLLREIASFSRVEMGF